MDNSIKILIDDIQELSLALFKKGVIIQGDGISEKEYFNKFGVNILVDRFSEFNQEALEILVNVVKNQYPSAEELNKTFFKSWDYVEHSSQEDLRIDHILNYLSVYGLGLDKHYDPRQRRKEVGVKVSKDTITVDLNQFVEEVNSFMPKDVVVNKEQFIIVNTMTLEEFKEALKGLLETNIALDSKEIGLIKDILRGGDVFTVNEKREIFDQTQNKEISIFLANEFLFVSKDPQRFLEELLYFITGDTILIKNKKTVSDIIIDLGDSFKVAQVKNRLERYISDFGENQLASVYLRNKVIFLAIKKGAKSKAISKIINRLNKLAKKGAHNPLVISDYLKITFDKDIDLDKVLPTLDINYLVRIANALIYRINTIKADNNTLLYIVRNGKSFYKEGVKLYKKKFYKKRLKAVKKELERKINLLIQEKKLILKNQDNAVIDYALPTSGKKFIQDIPFGSVMKAPENGELVAGIFWTTEETGGNVDFDLSFVNQKAKIGWNAYYSDNKVLFSGDMVDSTKGATELLLIKDRTDLFYKVTNNLFDTQDRPLDNENFKFFIGSLDDSDIEKMINDFTTEARLKMANKVSKMINDEVLASVPLYIDKANRGLELGYVYEKGFVFMSLKTPYSVSEIAPEKRFKAFQNKATSFIKFSDLQLKSYEPQEEEEVLEIDFNNISKAELLSLVSA